MTREDFTHLMIDYMAGKVTCKEFTEAVTDYLEGSQTFLKWVRFQMHMGLCLGCRAYLRQMKQTVRTLGHLPGAPVPPAVREDLLGRFQTWRQQSGT